MTMSSVLKDIRLGTDQTDNTFYTREFIPAYGQYATIAWELDEIIFTYRTEQLERINDRDGSFFLYMTLTPMALPHLASIFAFATNLPNYFRERGMLHYRSLEGFSKSANKNELISKLRAGLLVGGSVPGIFNGQWAASLNDRIDFSRCPLNGHYALFSETPLSHYDKIALACCYLKTNQGKVAIPLTNNPYLIPELYSRTDAIILNKQMFHKLEAFIQKGKHVSLRRRILEKFTRKSVALPPPLTPGSCIPGDVLQLPSGPFLFSQEIKELAQLFAPEEIKRARDCMTTLEADSHVVVRQLSEKQHNDLAVLVLMITMHVGCETITYNSQEKRVLTLSFKEHGGLTLAKDSYSITKGSLPNEHTINIMASAFMLWEYLQDNHVRRFEVNTNGL